MQVIENEQTATCGKCGNEEHKESWKWNDGLCNPCFTKQRALEDAHESSKTHLEGRIEKWDVLCPEIYRKGSTEFMDEYKLAQVKRWKFGSNGLLCMGASRKGKTTSVWNLLHKIFVLEGKSFIALSEPEFSIIREKKTRNGDLDFWLSRCINVDVLFLDDIGHAASTSRHMEELYHIVEKRTSWKRPILATTQFSSNEIQEKAGKTGNEKTALAILNRMFSFCDIIEF